MPNDSSDDTDINRNAPYRSSRREAKRGTTPRSPKERRLTVRSELREQPDVRKVARAIIAMAMAEAEREAQAKAAADGNALGREEKSADE